MSKPTPPGPPRPEIAELAWIVAELGKLEEARRPLLARRAVLVAELARPRPPEVPKASAGPPPPEAATASAGPPPPGEVTASGRRPWRPAGPPGRRAWPRWPRSTPPSTPPPGCWARPLVLGVVAAAIALAGGRARLVAPLLLGGAVVILDAGHELAPAVQQLAGVLPRWVPIAVIGVVLLVVGATYEARLRDLGRIRAALGRMR